MLKSKQQNFEIKLKVLLEPGNSIVLLRHICYEQNASICEISNNEISIVQKHYDSNKIIANDKLLQLINIIDDYGFNVCDNNLLLLK